MTSTYLLRSNTLLKIRKKKKKKNSKSVCVWYKVMAVNISIVYIVIVKQICLYRQRLLFFQINYSSLTKLVYSCSTKNLPQEEIFANKNWIII